MDLAVLKLIISQLNPLDEYQLLNLIGSMIN